MSDKKEVIIVDKNGNAIENTKGNKLLFLSEKTVLSILEVGVPLCTALVAVINLVNSKKFAHDCSNFYGVDKKYFDGTEIFQDRVIFVIAVVAIAVYSFIVAYSNKKINSKIYKVFSFVLVVMILYMQNIRVIVCSNKLMYGNWIWRFNNSYAVVVILFIADIIISYFIIIRNVFWKKQKFKKVELIILFISLILYISNVAIGIEINWDYKISDKRNYEVIDSDKAVISNYDGKFVLVNCKIINDELILKKGSYRLEEMTGKNITYHEYRKVTCVS